MKWSVRVFERRGPRENKRLQADDFQVEARTIDAAKDAAKDVFGKRGRGIVGVSAGPGNTLVVYLKPRVVRRPGRAVAK